MAMQRGSHGPDRGEDAAGSGAGGHAGGQPGNTRCQGTSELPGGGHELLVADVTTRRLGARELSA
jgi:hypothetical protein